MDFAFEVTIDVHDLTGAQFLLDIKRVQKEDAPTINPDSLQYGANLENKALNLYAACERSLSKLGIRFIAYRNEKRYVAMY